MIKQILLSTTLAAGLSALAVTPALAGPEEDAVRQAIENALPGTLIHDPLNYDWETRGSDVKSKVVKAKELNTGEALQVRVKKKKQNPWDTAISMNMDKPVKTGDTIEVHFWARTAKASAGKETAIMTLYVGRTEEPYDNILAEEIKPGSEWKMQTLRGIAKRDFGPGKVKAEFQLAKYAQTVEFGPIYISNLGGS